MSFGGLSNWPPIWTSVANKQINTLTGELGNLKHAITDDQLPCKCFLVIEYEGENYMGSLLFDDAAFCNQIADLLQFYLGSSIEKIGDLDITFTL